MFALVVLLLCVILHIMLSGKCLQLLCILPFGIVRLSVIRMMFVKILLAVYSGLSESRVFGKLCPVGFLVVCECSSFFCSL